MKFQHLSIAVAAALALTSPLMADSATVLHVKIEQQSLSSALNAFAKVAGLQLMADATLLEGKKTSRLEGNYTLKEAFSKLLHGSGLEAIIQGDTVMIQKISTSSSSTLEAIAISASSVAPFQTEGTHSYTTKRMSTATKLGLSIRETPQSVTVLTQQKLEDLGVSSYQEMLENVTGVSLNRMDERVYPTARGFDVDYYLFDGMPTYAISDAGANDIDLFLYDRVEVVKGANGLMTGAGNPAVGLNFIRKHANSQEPKGSVEVSAGSWDAYSASMDVSSALNEEGNVRGRVVAKHEDKHSYMDGYEKINDVVYGVVDMDVTDTTYVSIAAEYQKLERNGIRWGGLPAFYSDGTRTDFSRSKTVSEDWTYWNNETKALYVDVKQYLYNDISLNLAYSYRKLYSETSLFYFSGTVDKATGIGEGGIYHYISDKESVEQNLDLYVSAPFEFAQLDHEVVLGVMRNVSDTKYDHWGSSGYVTSTLIAPAINFYSMNTPRPTLSSYGENTPDKTTQTGIYVAGKFSLMDDLKLITGVRVSDWKSKSDDGSDNRHFQNELTPYVGLIYHLNENHSLYASYTDIFKPQTYKDIHGTYLDPIVGKNYETGIKGEYFDKRLNASLSIFRVEQDNLGEATSSFVPGSTDYAYVSTDGVVSKGFEVDINGEITDNWQIGFGLANFEAKDANGNKVQTKSSRTMANVFTKYSVAQWGFGVGLNYRSKIYTGSGAAELTQDAYILTNAMVSYDVDKHMKLQLNVNNIFDKEYYEGLGSDGMIYGSPRNATLSFKYTF